MATTVKEFEPKKYRRERQDDFKKYYERAYIAGQGATLSSMDLELGDSLPDNSSAEIVESWIETDGAHGGRIAHVRALEFLLET